MITPDSTQFDLQPILRERRRPPIELTVGNPFVPTCRLILTGPEELGRKHFTLEREQVSDVSPGAGNELLSAVRDSQLRFAQVDLNRRPKSASALDNLGVTHLNRGELGEAEECFGRALELKPEFFPSLVHLAKVRLLQGRVDEAVATYERLRASRPMDQDVVVNLAAIEIQRGNNDGAFKVLSEAVREGLQNEHVLNAFGVSKLLREDVNGAIGCFRRALKENVRFLPAQNNLGATYMAAKNYHRAERALRTSLTLDRGNAPAAKNLAELFIGRGRHREALAILEEYVPKERRDLEVRTCLSLCLLNLGEHSRAMRELQEAIRSAEGQKAPVAEQARLYNNLGVVYQRVGDYERAESCCEEAIALAPGADRRFWYNLMGMYAQRRNVRGLESVIARAAAMYPDDPRLDLYRSRYYALRGEYEEAMQVGRRALEGLVDSVEPHYVLSAIAGEVFGDYDEAIRLSRQGLVKDPGNRILMNNLAYYLLMKGDVSTARRMLDQLAERDDEVHLRATRGLLLLKEGNFMEGARLYNEAWKRAQGQELKNLILQKKNLELARIAIGEGRKSEAERLLLRANAVKSGEATYKDQARELLEELRRSDRPTL